MATSNESNAKVFIGMPVYNGGRFLTEAIESIRNQSFTQWHLFISDDCSTDNSPEIAKRFAALDPRITYHPQAKNLGMFANMKFTLDQADTPYFLLAAQDDVRESEYLKTTVEFLEKNSSYGFATSRMAAIDSLGRELIKETTLTRYEGAPSALKVAKFILEPEILGKCNLMYGLFRTEVAKAVWQLYPLRKVWGPDYHFSLALVSHFKIHVDPAYLFRKRLGGFSSPEALKNDSATSFKPLHYPNPKNLMFPFGRFRNYLAGHMEALRDTLYQPLAVILLMLRLPRAFIIHLKERNFRKFFGLKI